MADELTAGRNLARTLIGQTLRGLGSIPPAARHGIPVRLIEAAALVSDGDLPRVSLLPLAHRTTDTVAVGPIPADLFSGPTLAWTGRPTGIPVVHPFEVSRR